MRPTRLVRMVVAFMVVAFLVAPAASLSCELPADQADSPGRGDDLARIQAWRSFLDRAHRAFTAAKMSTTAVKAKITEADERVAELEDDREGKKAGRSDITGDVEFLERAFRAFTAAKMSTTDVKKWLAEAKEASEA